MLQGASAGFPVNCEQVIATLHLKSGAKAIGLGPDSAFGSAMGAVIHDLNPAVQRGQVALGRARKPGDQARGANQVADAYGRAASALKHLPPNPAAAGAAAALAAPSKRSNALTRRSRVQPDTTIERATTPRGDRSPTLAARSPRRSSQLSHLGYVST